MSKDLVATIKLQIPAGKANPSPPVGPALGAKGVNIMEFCKAFNARSQENKDIAPGTPLPVIINVYADKSFNFIIKTPPASYLIIKKFNLDKGSTNPGTKIIKRIKKEELSDIAKVKMPDINANELEPAIRIIAGTARSMGIIVED